MTTGGCHSERSEESTDLEARGAECEGGGVAMAAALARWKGQAQRLRAYGLLATASPKATLSSAPGSAFHLS